MVTSSIESRLQAILKSYDRIGFGRRGVLDAEGELRRFAAGLTPDERARVCELVIAWVTPDEAERIAATLHYNLPEHIQILALGLCASLPIPESLPRLRQLQRDRTTTHATPLPWSEALHAAIARLEQLPIMG